MVARIGFIVLTTNARINLFVHFFYTCFLFMIDWKLDEDSDTLKLTTKIKVH